MLFSSGKAGPAPVVPAAGDPVAAPAPPAAATSARPRPVPAGRTASQPPARRTAAARSGMMACWTRDIGAILQARERAGVWTAGRGSFILVGDEGPPGGDRHRNPGRPRLRR